MKKKDFLKIWLCLVLAGIYLPLQSQITYDGIFGEGLKFKARDGSFGLKFTTRIQPQYNFTTNLETGETLHRMRIRRARLKFDGFFIRKELRYKIEYDVVGGYVRDAILKYRFARKFDLWFGQAKLPGNRERLFSSANLEMVDRSLFTLFYTLDRDLGFQLHFQETLNNMLFRGILAISAGNGIRNIRPSKGMDFTAKVEWLPFGSFTKKGDYIGGDLYREEHFKLSFAFGADYNMAAYKSMGQIGIFLEEEKDLLLFNADVYMKYRGFSLLIEAGNRVTPNSNAEVYDSEGSIIGAYYTGFGMNFQAGYVFKKMWLVTARHAFTNPSIDYYSRIRDYTLGTGRYIAGNKFKILADFTYRDDERADNSFIGRLQMEFQF